MRSHIRGCGLGGPHPRASGSRSKACYTQPGSAAVPCRTGRAGTSLSSTGLPSGRITFQSSLSAGVASPVAARFAAIRDEMNVPTVFSDDVLAEARAAARAAVTAQLPDMTDVPLFTIDPSGSMDLDQAMHLERDGSGYRVRYAIADVPAFVRPGGAIDQEAHRRGTTIYCPDGRFPLHPEVLSEDAASLLPGKVRPAFVWNIRLDAEGNETDSSVARAAVRSVVRLNYVEAAESRDASIALLREIGELRIALQQQRGGGAAGRHRPRRRRSRRACRSR